MAELFVQSIPRSSAEGGVKLALGSHNIRSIAYVLALLEKQALPESALEVQKLYGMADQLQAALMHRGLRIREYIPLGQMIPGMAYFVRRLLENTSNQSWLRAGFSGEVSDEVLLASPHSGGGRIAGNNHNRNVCPAPQAFAGRGRAGRRPAHDQRTCA